MTKPPSPRPLSVRRVVKVLFALLALSNPARADTPPSWSDFTVLSANGQYQAEVKDVSDPKGPHGFGRQLDKFQLVISKVVASESEEPSASEPWSCEYNYQTGYGGGMLSDDGSTFVTVNFWYEDDYPVVEVYRNGRQIGSLIGRDFNILESALEKTVSHQLWLASQLYHSIRPIFIRTQAGALALEIITRDGQRHFVDLETVRLMPLLGER